MPNIENLERKPLRESRLLNVRREDIIYREDIRISFFYALVGAAILAGVAAIGYMGIQQLKK